MIYEILSGLWICNKDDINNNFLINKNISLIINSTKELTNNNYKNNIEEIQIPFEINNNIEYINNIFFDYIFDTIKYIHINKLNKNILIYSTNNDQRPISIIISYIIYYSHMEPLQTILFIKSKCYNISLSKPIYLISFNKIYEKIKKKLLN